MHFNLIKIRSLIRCPSF